MQSNPIFMKTHLLSFLLVLIFSFVTMGQSIQDGKTLFQNGDYECAIRVFNSLDDIEAQLFTAKSHFALGNYYKARNAVKKVLESNSTEFAPEAKFTEALILFQLDDFAGSLESLNDLKNNHRNSFFYSRGLSLYDQQISYLSLDQIKGVFQQTNNAEVLLDVISGALGRINRSKALSLLNTYKSIYSDESISSSDELIRIEEVLSDSLMYSSKYPFKKYSYAPNGMSYHIGVALPSFDMNSQNYEIPQHLYFGIQMAVEEFNADQPNKKAFIHFAKTNNDSENAEDVLNQLVWERDVDAVIGPLFSEVASSFSDLAEAYEVPVLTPLANSDTLNLANNYFFQANPTFAVQGKKMAQYAVNNLGLDTLAVLADSRSLGAASALAFRHEAERLGAFIQHFFLEDLESNGYDIFEYTENLSKTDTLVPAPGLKAIYAPFTGAAATTLVRNLITDLEASQSDYILLGSEEWADVDLESIRLNETSIHFSSGFEVSYGETPAEEFASSFRIRFQTEPNRFAFIGYDVAKVILNTLSRVENPAYLKNGLLEISNYQGLTSRFSFEKEHINQFVRIKSIERSE